MKRLAAPALALIALLGVATPASAKDFHFPRVEIVATIGPDGSMTVVEDRTYRFDGAFGRAFMSLPLDPSWEYAQFQVLEGRTPLRPARPENRDPVRTPGTFHIDQESASVKLTWYYRARDEDRTFRISYRVLRAVKAYDDVGELFWKFVGDGWDVPTDEVRYRVVLPEPGATFPDLRIFQHGPLSGEIRAVSDTEVVGTTRDVPPRTSVEARILLPLPLVPDAERLDGTRLPFALAEEKRLAEDANAVRRRARSEAAAGAGLPLLGFAVFFYLFFRFGKEYKPEVGQYFHEPPETYPPAVTGYLYRFGASKVDDLTATFLDLARRGFLRIAQQDDITRPGGGHLFERTSPPADDRPAPFEHALMQWAFDEVGDGTRVNDAELAAYAASPGNDFASWYRTWTRMVRSEADRLGWIEKGSVAKMWVNLVIGLLVLIAGIGMVAALRTPAGALPIAGGIVQIALSRLIKRRSWRGSTDYQKWKAFRRFLSDFSEIERMPPAALPVWEQYLVYAVPLGVAGQVVASMRRLAPAYRQATGADLSPAWLAAADGAGGIPDLGSLTTRRRDLGDVVGVGRGRGLVRRRGRRGRGRRRRGRLMGDMTFADLQREVFGAHGIGDYRKALEAVEQEGGRFPDQEWRIYYWRACLTSRLNDVQAALQLLDEALAHGHWFPESTLRRDEDLRPLWGLPEFERVVEVCKARQQEAQQAAITKLITVEPEAEPPFPLLIALHGSLSNAESSVPFWRPAVERGWLLAVPQSSQVGPVGFLWGDRDWAAREIGEHHAALLESHGVDPERVVLGGFSRGAEVAAWLAMSGAIPARGLVAVGPPVGDLDDWQPLLGPAREAGVRGYLLVGEEDQFCLEGTKGLGAMLNYNGIPCEVDLRPGLGHDFPPDFDRTLARALDYILGDAS